VTDGVAIPTSTTIFSAMPDSDVLLSALPDIVRHCQTLIDYCKSRWRSIKPEIEMNGLSLRPDFNDYSYICDHSGHVCDSADADRR
jgi:hypothetical protein